ncbi:MAG: hypothetical protein VSS52_003100 [Thiotrichaceae bacterium]|nr:hypothetical protein [Thiotrichaceae bacterium]
MPTNHSKQNATFIVDKVLHPADFKYFAGFFYTWVLIQQDVK